MTFLHTRRSCLGRSPRVDIDKRKAVGDKVIAHVHHIRLRIKDDGISIRVTGREVQRPDVLTIQVNGNVMLEGDQGQRHFGGRLLSDVNCTAIARTDFRSPGACAHCPEL